MELVRLKLSAVLWALEKVIRRAARKSPSLMRRLLERDFTAQIQLRDNSQGRLFIFHGGNVTSKNGVHEEADISLLFHNAELAVRLLKPHRSQLDFLHAVKNFQLIVTGPDDLAVWFAETLGMVLQSGEEYGTDRGNGVHRYTANTNGGPVFVDVQNDKILRITPIDFDDEDAQPWTIKARGQEVSLRHGKPLSVHIRWPGNR